MVEGKSKVRQQRALLECECLILQGRSKDQVLEVLIEDYGYAANTANNMYYMAAKSAGDRLEEFMATAKKAAVSKLLAISDKAYDQNKLGDSIKAIDLLNKVFGNYSPEKLEVTGDEPIKIVFE